VCFSVFVFVLCVGKGFAIDWSLAQGVLPTVYRIKKLEKRQRPKKRALELITIIIIIMSFLCFNSSIPDKVQ
jgi:hypothetical protein